MNIRRDPVVEKFLLRIMAFLFASKVKKTKNKKKKKKNNNWEMELSKILSRKANLNKDQFGSN